MATIQLMKPRGYSGRRHVRVDRRDVLQAIRYRDGGQRREVGSVQIHKTINPFSIGA